MDDFENLFISTHGRSFWETQAMKTTIRLFSFGLALLLSATVSTQSLATCQQLCLIYKNTVRPAQTRPQDIWHYNPTLPPRLTRPPVLLRSFTIPPAAPTRPMVEAHSSATLRAATTRQSEMMRSSTTLPATITQPSAKMR